MTSAFTPYSTLSTMFPVTMPTWIPNILDQQRIESYRLYEQIYWGVPETFKLVARGTEDKPIYLPNGMIVVNTTVQYTTPGQSFRIEPTVLTPATSETIAAATQFMNDFFARERFRSKLNGNKLYGSIRGDWLWYVKANPAKLPGTRLSLNPLDPAQYFPIYNADDVDKVEGCHIVDQFIPPGEKDLVIKRSTYLKPGTTRNPAQWVQYDEQIFELDDWEGPKSKPKKTLVSMQLNGITNLPVYHIKNFEEPGNPFGSSTLRGHERVIAAINQSISDEDLALALDGIGVYGTDAGPPVDAVTGEPIPYRLGPGRVIEHDTGAKFYRINGVSSVGPFQDHIKSLVDFMREGSQTPAVAIGKVDVSVAQSGVALAIQFSPMLAKTARIDDLIVEGHDQLWYDLATEWFPVYESVRFDGMRIKTIFGDKLPPDREKSVKELTDMLNAGVIDRQYYRDEMTKFGYTFPADIAARVETEQQAQAALLDSFGARSDEELNSQDADPEAGE
jgi:hypothetical protein